MRLRPRGSPALLLALAAVCAVGILALAPTMAGPATAGTVAAGDLDEEAPGCPEEPREPRDEDDGDEDPLARPLASWRSAPPMIGASRRERGASVARRGHGDVIERPPRG